MSAFNINNDFKTLVEKGSIKANEYVKVHKNGDWETYCDVITEDGRIETFTSNELMRFGYIKATQQVIDIVEDFRRKQDKFGNRDVFHGMIHLTKNVRSSVDIFSNTDILYTNLYGNCYKYCYREMTDDEVIQILLDEILYGIQPLLISSSCVGTSAKGIDKNPNYHDGNYHLCNGKDYTMTYCRNTVIIREGKDGGWYKGTNDVGREIYRGEIDWLRLQKAMVMRGATALLTSGYRLFEQFPEIGDILYNHLKNEDRYKLNSEYEN